MAAYPARMTEGRRILVALLTGALCFTASSPAIADVAATKAGLQQIATRIRQATDRTARGDAAKQYMIEGFRRELAALQSAASQADDVALAAKAAAIERALGQLEDLVVRPPVAEPPIPTMPSRPLDRETITRNHGDQCATALGLSTAAPVRLVLGRAAAPGAQAWFRLAPSDAAYGVIASDSDNADPAIAVFADCGANSALADNDDSVGLDAVVAVHNTNPSALYVRLTNGGDAGAVTLSVAETDTTISGKITDAKSGQPIYQAHVILLSGNGNYIYPDTYTDAGGNYSIAELPGSYYVSAQAPLHVGAVYPDAQCGHRTLYFSISNCPSGQAQLVAVTGTSSVTSVDVALQTGHKIGGTIRDQDGNALAGFVRLNLGNGTQVTGTYSDAYGRYVFSTLPTGDYKVQAEVGGYGSQWYDHVACGGALQTNCAIAAGTTIALADQDLGTIDFNLPKLSAIAGSVLDQDSQPLPNYTAVTILDTNGNPVILTNADLAGHYRAGPLAVGTYYAYATSLGYYSQLFDGTDCGSSCEAQVASAAPIAIGSNGQTKNADFRLNELPLVHGHVEDSVSGLPLAGVEVFASSNPPEFFNSLTTATTDAGGNYELTGTPPGAYYLWAQSVDHIDEIYPSITCENTNYSQAQCDVSGAALLQIDVGQTPPAFDFALAPASSVSGKVFVDAGDGSDLPASAEVDIYNGAGLVIGIANSDALGNYIVPDVAPGTVYAVGGGTYLNNDDWVGQVWSMNNCIDTCLPTTGTPIIVVPNSNAGDIDFRLVARRAIVGRVTDSFGAPIDGALVDLFDATNGTYRATGPTDAAGYYAATYYASGSYFVATDATAYVDQVHSGIFCPAGPAYFGLCSLDAATPVALDNQSPVPRIVNFSLTARELIFLNGFE